MKKNTLFILPIFFTALISFAVPADTKIGNPPSNIIAPKPSCPLTSETVKIRYLDPYRIIPGLEKWEDERMKIQKELEAKARHMEELKTQYQTKVNQVQTMGAVAKAEVKENALKELKHLEKIIEVEQQSFQESAERMSQEAQMMIFREIEAAAKEYALEEKIDFIFAGGAIYVNPAYEISDIIVARMNERYRAQKKKEEPATKPAQPTFGALPTSPSNR